MIPHNDVINIIKPNGEKIENIKAGVQTNKTFIRRSDILIETGDLIERKMSNGGSELYDVIDPGFREQGVVGPAHYQIKHKKRGLPNQKKDLVSQNITYNLNGTGAKINNDSIDNSVNTFNTVPKIAEHIKQLRSEIKEHLNSDKQQDALEITNEIENQFELTSPNKTIIKSLVSALPNAGSIASIGSFILAALVS